MTSFLDKETLTLIQETAKKSVEPKLIPLPNDPENFLLLVAGEARPVKAPFVAGPRVHTVESIHSFAAAYDRWAQPASETTKQTNIWIDLKQWQLKFFTDEPLRKSWILLELRPSPQLEILQGFETAQSLDQRILVRMLRHDLADCVDPGVLAAFRSVDFQKVVNARAQMQHERQSLDSDVVAQVLGEKKPDVFVVDAPLFAMKELDARSRVGITIDIDCDNKKFVLQAKPGHLDDALDTARAAVLTRLEAELVGVTDDTVAILHGTP